ncbi:MAG: DegT/DnrJ/EryC1/StrS aminotransferase family protein [candidate division Zixibacteria bacterium]|nr:DegT/DnrJ/EryC1/StrS aminotransferase family protein [candidate division Zixibacteria bacterium]
MAITFKKYPPVASDLPPRAVMAARRSKLTSDECLKEVAEYLGARYLFPVNSGRTALYLILKAALAPGSKVVLPGYTCYTVAAAVIKAGMMPVLCDSDPADLGYDLDALRKTIHQHPNIKAVVVCHLFGIAVDIDAIRGIVGSETLIVDDAAQGYGIKAKGRFLGLGGNIGFFSFGRGKNLSLVGGGLLATNNDFLGEKITALSEAELPGAESTGKEWLMALAYNPATHPFWFNILSRLPGITLGVSRFDPEFPTAETSMYKIRLLHEVFRMAEAENENRLRVARRYMELLQGRANVALPRSRVDGNPGTLRFPVLVANVGRREEILRQGSRRGWGLSGMYPTALNRIPRLSQESAANLPGAEAIARSIVTLPTHRFVQRAGTPAGIVERIAGLF